MSTDSEIDQEVRGPQGSWSSLRRFTRKAQPLERCELCGLALAPEHAHLLEHAARQVLCACDACSLLFSGSSAARYRRVPRRILRLADFRLADELWNDLLIPINMAFIFHSSAQGKPIAMYPSPAGATESLLELPVWEQITVAAPILATIEPDVETLLVNRLGTEHEYYLAPIDECFRLVGLVRLNWRGLSGGSEVQEAIRTFFDKLRHKASTV